MNAWKFVSCYVVLIATTGVFAGTIESNRCCQDNNDVIKDEGSCSSGQRPAISCTEMFVIDLSQENITIDSKNNLLMYEDDIFPPEDYCIGRLERQKSNEVALVCTKNLESELSWTLRAICAMISSICLILTIIVYIYIPSLRDIQGKCIINAIFGLAVAFMLLAAIQFGIIPEILCAASAFTFYFFFMTSFFWLNILSFNIWKTIVKPPIIGKTRDSFLCYCIYGYGVPTIFFIITIISHHHPEIYLEPGFGKESCWFQTQQATWIYFYGPLAVLLVINIFFFCWTAKVLYKNLKRTDPKCKSLKYKFSLYLKLFVIMGLNWIFEVLSFAFGNNKNFIDYIWIVTDYMNSLQGILIFIILVILRKKVLRSLANKRLCCIQFPKAWKALEDDECEIPEETQIGLSQMDAIKSDFVPA